MKKKKMMKRKIGEKEKDKEEENIWERKDKEKK